MSNNLKTKMEIGLAQILKDDLAFAGVNIYPFSDSTDAADSHPTIIVKCESAPRDSDLALEMHAFHYIESTDTQSETDGTIFRINVGMTIFVEEVIQ